MALSKSPPFPHPRRRPVSRLITSVIYRGGGREGEGGGHVLDVIHYTLRFHTHPTLNDWTGFSCQPLAALKHTGDSGENGWSLKVWRPDGDKYNKAIKEKEEKIAVNFPRLSFHG